MVVVLTDSSSPIFTAGRKSDTIRMQLSGCLGLDAQEQRTATDLQSRTKSWATTQFILGLRIVASWFVRKQSLDDVGPLLTHIIRLDFHVVQSLETRRWADR